jgi:hypothetical protein
MAVQLINTASGVCKLVLQVIDLVLEFRRFGFGRGKFVLKLRVLRREKKIANELLYNNKSITLMLAKGSQLVIQPVIFPGSIT